MREPGEDSEVWQNRTMDIPARPRVSCLSLTIHVVEAFTTITVYRTYNVLGVLALYLNLAWSGSYAEAHGL